MRRLRNWGYRKLKSMTLPLTQWVRVENEGGLD